MPTATLHPLKLSPLHALAEAYGLELGFTDAFDKEQATPEIALQKVLVALGASPCDTPDACIQRLAEHKEAQWMVTLPAMIVQREGDDSPIRVQLPFMPKQPLSWELIEERGQKHSGQLQLSPMNKMEEMAFERKGLILSKKELFFAWEWNLDIDLPQGYHKIALSYKDDVIATSTLVRVPRQAYSPPEMDQGQLWGVTSQLYSLKSDDNFGIGDTQDIRTLINQVAPKGCATIGLNPMHELFPHNPAEKSPYSPSSRYFLNYLYIHPQATPEFQKSDAAQQVFADITDELEACRASELVDYVKAAELKRPVLDAMFDQFSKEMGANSERAQAYLDFCKRKGSALMRLAQYEALSEDFHKKDENLWGWPVWPEAFRDCETVEVKSACVRLQERVRYFMYLQFLMDDQLSSVAHYAKEQGMPIGLYLDLAVGTNLGSADVWMNRELYSLDASIGCPPDLFNMMGQNWGLPPMKPDILKAQGYDAFITLLRSNMAYAGALRIDHALAIFRAFWIPPGETGQNGAYVKYPTNDLLGLIALESHRSKCLVIGEDLGTVPEWVRDVMMDWNVFSYRIFYFERDDNNRYLRPDEYPEQALVAVSTHDLPTLQGFWQGHDVELRHELNLFPSEEKYWDEKNARPSERQHLLDALIHNGVMPDGYPHNHAEYHGDLPKPVADAVNTFLAMTPCKLRVVQLEDALGNATQVNMPGTVNENPNWVRKLRVNTDQLGQFV